MCLHDKSANDVIILSDAILYLCELITHRFFFLSVICHTHFYAQVLANLSVWVLVPVITRNITVDRTLEVFRVRIAKDASQGSLLERSIREPCAAIHSAPPLRNSAQLFCGCTMNIGTKSSFITTVGIARVCERVFFLPECAEWLDWSDFCVLLATERTPHRCWAASHWGPANWPRSQRNCRFDVFSLFRRRPVSFFYVLW